MTVRRAKILATLGPASRAPETLAALTEAGADGFRINASHGKPAEWREDARSVRHAAGIAGRPLTLVFDLCGPKRRISADAAERHVALGDTLRFGDGADAIAVATGSITAEVTPGLSHLVVGDGTPRFEVLTAEQDGVTARCLRAGDLGPGKGLHITHSELTQPAITDKDLHDLDVAVEVGADWIAQSFVRSGEDVHLLRRALTARGSTARIIAKIEKLDAVADLEAILAASDGVMVARGDLGIEAGVSEVPLLQKDILRAARGASCLAVTATQMLESMLTSAEPTRAEASDIANAVLDGATTLMLSGETAIGAHPVEAVQVMADIAYGAQRAAHSQIEVNPAVRDNAEAVIRSAAHLAQQIDAAALVIPTTTGGSARAASNCRTARPIIAITRDETVANQLAIEWGVQPGVLPAHPGRIEELIDEAVSAAAAIGGLEAGDTVVVTYGQSGRVSGGTDLIAVRAVGSPKRSGFESDPAHFRR